MAKKNEGSINKTICDINSNGEEFVRRYEEEREKCVRVWLCSKNWSFWWDT